MVSGQEDRQKDKGMDTIRKNDGTPNPLSPSSYEFLRALMDYAKTLEKRLERLEERYK